MRVKERALEIIRNDLGRKIEPGIISTGSMSDPYNPLEKQLQLTRHSLELISAYRFGVAIASKSPLVTRDADVLREVAAQQPVIVKLSITCADDELSRIIEPNVAKSSERFAAIAELSRQNIYAGVLLMPLLPYINDTEENVLSLVQMAKESGARFIFPGIGLTLRSGQREYFYQQLDKHFPGLKQKYISRYGSRYQASSPKARSLFRSFAQACEQEGLLYQMRDIIRSYKNGYVVEQLRLF